MRVSATIFILFFTINLNFAQSAIQVAGNSVSKTERGSSMLGNVVVSNLGMLNSSDLDYSPILFKDGVVFTSTRKYVGSKRKAFRSKKKAYSYLFYSKRNSRGEFKEPAPLKGKINGRYHEGTATFNQEGTLMFFTRNTNEGKNSYGKVNLKIYVAKNINGYWKEIEELPFNSDRFSVCHPSISKDGKRLYFASNKNGGFGGMDIYVSHYENGRWQYPVNLGPEVNSAQNETFPFIDEKDALYFSSDGHGGKGGLDIFKSKITDAEEGTWSKPANIGQPFNSPKDDFGFTVYNNSQDGFFTSSREGGKGRDDIYTWHKAYIPQADEAEPMESDQGFIEIPELPSVDPLKAKPAFSLKELVAVLVKH